MVDAEQTALARLAAAAGIEPRYRDTAGIMRETAPETALALLAAMGFAVETEAAVIDSLARLMERTARRVVPPVIVAQPGASVPLASAVGPAEWRIEFETGESLTGSIDGTALMLPADLALGYHHLILGNAETRVSLIIVPPSAYLPPWLERGGRRWGIACPLFSLWSEHSQGIGDFSDLTELALEAAKLGAMTIGLNPLHALAPGEPEQANPYWPSSRLFLNTLHLDLRAIDPDFEGAAGFGSHIDYTEVQTRKNAALEAIYQRFAAGPPDAEFERFADGGYRLQCFALFSVLTEKFGPLHWPDWPEEMRSPAAPGIPGFAAEHAERVRYHSWLQWHADKQFGHAAAALAGAVEDGSFYGDLAVGVSPTGADAWADQQCYAIGARFGAPPDGFTPAGQDWGMPPPHPVALVEQGYAPFIAALRANMRHARILRIDHVMGLARLYWIPAGAPATAGAYVRYPFQDLLGIIALESRRNRCTVIGEDLGTLPDGFREHLADAHILSYRVLGFERWEGGLYRRPEAYPPLALATSGTHDLPSLAGWWRGDDIALRIRLGLLFAADPAHELADRQHERELLVAALSDQGLLPADFPVTEALDDAGLGRVIAAAQGFLARSPAALLMVNLVDLFAERVQINLPGTVLEHTNWRHRSGRPIDGLAADPLVRDIVATIRAEGRR
jgi:4-alpha-glucanotransferase